MTARSLASPGSGGGVAALARGERAGRISGVERATAVAAPEGGRGGREFSTAYAQSEVGRRPGVGGAVSLRGAGRWR